MIQTSADRGTFIHEGNSNNILNHWTTLNHPMTKDQPNATIGITSNWGRSGTYNNHPIGVWYSGGHWHIFNQDRSVIPQGVRFNVLVDYTYQ